MDDSTASRWTRLGYLFPELELRLAKLRGAAVPTPDPTSADAAAAARVYLDNQARMALVAQAVGARFVSIFQPIAELHRHVDPLWGSRDGVMVPFHDAVTKAPSSAYEAHDFVSLFDEEFASVPVTRGDIADDTVFVDSVHLTDRGNEIVARRLLRALRLR